MTRSTSLRLLGMLAAALLLAAARSDGSPDRENFQWKFGGVGFAAGGDEERNIERLAVNQVQPSYPSLAQKYRIEGVVTVQVSVDRNGKVLKAEFVRGHTIFRSVSLDAAKMWEFKPPEADGLVGTIRFTFRLKG